MKRTEEEKKMICEVLDKYANGSHLSLHQFKKDNDLLLEDKSGWYISDDEGDGIFVRYQDYENNMTYGVGFSGNWFNQHLGEMSSDCYPATPKQVQERLTKCALKMGYGERQSECLSSRGVRCEIDLELATFDVCHRDNTLLIEDSHCNRNKIFDNGIWAKFIPTEREKIEAEIKKLQEKLDELK